MRDEMQRAYEAVFFDLFGTLVDDQGAALPDAARVLGELPPGRWAIVTSCSRRFAETLLERANLPVPEMIISAEDVVQGKPSPECYSLASRRFRLPPEQCLVVEDSRQGAAAGKSAGMDVVVVKRGRSAGFPENVRVIDTLDDLQLEKSDSGAIVLR